MRRDSRRSGSGRVAWYSRKFGRKEDLGYTAHNQKGQTRKHIAVIGAGASGLVCAKECLEEGHNVTVFEQGKASGGTWRIEPVPANVDELSIFTEKGRELNDSVHSSMYDTVKVVIPREMMGHTQFPFNYEFPGSKDTRKFCGPDEVRRYLAAFKEHFELERVIEYETKVVGVVPHDATNGTWMVELEHSSLSRSVRQFDAVVVANGHNTKPYIPVIENLENFGRPCLHSHVYRSVKPFAEKTVVIIGNSFSGRDLARDLSVVAKKVYVCGKTWESKDGSFKIGGANNVHLRSAVAGCQAEGELMLEDKSVLRGIDVLVFCTGYLYDFPFLKKSDLISTEERMVYPLYEQIFHTDHPTLAFLTLQTYVIPFLLAEFQSKLIARIVSGRCKLPDSSTMRQAVDRSIQQHRDINKSLQTFHNMQASHFEYMAKLASLCGDVDSPEEWRREMHSATLNARAKQHRQESLDTVYNPRLLTSCKEAICTYNGQTGDTGISGEQARD